MTQLCAFRVKNEATLHKSEPTGNLNKHLVLMEGLAVSVYHHIYDLTSP